MGVVSYNSVGGYSTGLTMTGVIDSLGNITGVGATFSGLIRANAGISASGATFSGNIFAPNIVNSFNGSTGAVQGVSAAVGSTYLTVSGSTGSVTFTNTGVQTFNGLTGAVTGVTVGGANTFTALNTFNAGLSGHINISSSNATGNMYLLMARGAGVTAVFADTTTTPLVYQPFAGNLGLKGITLANGSDRLYITPTQITATNTVSPSSAYFYFIAEGGNYLQSQNLSGIGDIGALNSALILSVDPSTRTMTWSDGVLGTGVTSGFFGVNRNPSGMCADYAVEINSPTGKGLQLIYNNYTGAASNWVNMDVSSGGNYTLRPSGGLATVTGTLNVSAGVCAAGATFSGDVTATGSIVGNQKINAQTVSYTLALTDNGKIVTMNSASGITATIPLNSSVGFPTGCSVTVVGTGTGTVGFTGSAGVTLRFTPGNILRAQYSAATCVKLATDEWLLLGDLTA